MDKESIKDRIKHIVTEEYKKYTSEPDRTDVYVHEDSVDIQFNSEVPYLHTDFWVMLGNVEPKLDEILNPEGFVYKNSMVLYDFIIWHYERKV